jgi:DNA-binding response OmpR family regulator
MARILVIDDERQILRNVLEILRFEGFEAVGAENGRTGIDSAKEIVPDLILCDIMMPEADGYTVLAELYAETDTAHIPVIIMSAKVDRDTTRSVLDAGAKDCLAKPFTMPELLAVVRKYVRAG